MGRYAITRRKTRAGAVVPKIHVRRSVVALIAGDSTTYVGSPFQQERDSGRPAAHATAATNIRHCWALVTRSSVRPRGRRPTLEAIHQSHNPLSLPHTLGLAGPPLASRLPSYASGERAVIEPVD